MTRGEDDALKTGLAQRKDPLVGVESRGIKNLGVFRGAGEGPQAEADERRQLLPVIPKLRGRGKSTERRRRGGRGTRALVWLRNDLEAQKNEDPVHPAREFFLFADGLERV
jgi:hypothetical protein